MKKISLLFILGITLTFLSGCNTVKEGFTNQKKNSSDEFLVEKKSPLVMPPEYNELPIPDQKDSNEQKKENNIKNLITNNNGDISNKNINQKSDTDLEESILSKIKNK